MKTVALVAIVVFFQLLCIGANFTTLKFYANDLGGTAFQVGLLWAALTIPRAILSPFWGSLSDRWGRKPLLILGTIGTIAGSTLWAFSATWTMLFFSRIVDSMLSGQAAVGSAIVGDELPPEKRAAAFGMLGASVAMGLTFGPALGGFVASAYGFPAVGWAMAIVQAFALLLIIFILPETRKRDERSPANTGIQLPLLQASVWRRIFAQRRVAWLLVLGLVMTIGYTHLNTAFPEAMEDWFDWGVDEVKWGFVVLGFVSAFVQGGAIRPLTKRFSETSLAVVGLIIMCAGFLMLGVKVSPTFQLVAVGIAAAGGGLALPCYTALISGAAGRDDQGAIMGLSQTAQGFGRGIGAMAGSVWYALGPAVPFFAAAGLVALALVPLRLAARGGKGVDLGPSKAEAS